MPKDRFIDHWREIIPWCDNLELRIEALEPKESEIKALDEQLAECADPKLPPNAGACRCQVCGVMFEAVPGAMQFQFCPNCEGNLLRLQVKEAHDKILAIKRDLKNIHAHEEWGESKVRAEVYNIVIKHFGL